MLSRRLFRYSTARGKSSCPTSVQDTLPFEAIPGPRPLPLVGNIWRYLPLIGDYNTDELYKNATFNKRKYGPIVREQITRKHVVLHLFDPQDVESFFRQDGSEPHRRSHRALLKFRQDRPERYNDGGIFPENGQGWARLRGLFNQHLMRKSEVEPRARLLDEITRHSIGGIVPNMDPSSPVVMEDFERFLQAWTVKCALAVFLDYDKEHMPDEQVLFQLLKCLDDLLAAIAGTEIRSERWARQPDKCPYYKTLSEVENYTYAFVQERIEHLFATGSFHERSFLRDWLMGEKIDRKDVITFILDCLLASVHTTTYTTVFLLENITRNLDEITRAKLQQEIQDRMPSITVPMTRDVFEDMPLLRDCLKETLRLKPVSIGTGRLTQHDMTIRNYRIPQGVMVIAHNQTICRDATLYEKPEEFCPVRWSDYRAQTRSDRPSRFAWLPYGFGPRACLGQRLVNLQMHILAARLLQNFNICFLGEIKTSTLLVHCLHGKIRVQLRPLDNSCSCRTSRKV